MALTRGATGTSRPRRANETTTTTTTTTKKTTTKPRAKTTTGRVTKGTKVDATHHKRKPSLADKVSGAIEKVVGKVERKPGKKVC